MSVSGAFTPWVDHVKLRSALWLNASTGQLHPEDITRHFSIESQNDVGGVITHIMNVRQVCNVGAEQVPNIKFGRPESKAPSQQRALQRANEILQEVSKDSPFIHIVDTYAFNPVRTDSKFCSYGTLEILKLKWKPGYKWFLMQSLPEFTSQDKLWLGMSSTVDSANHQNSIFHGPRSTAARKESQVVESTASPTLSRMGIFIHDQQRALHSEFFRISYD
jgi:hypothetical protein